MAQTRVQFIITTDKPPTRSQVRYFLCNSIEGKAVCEGEKKIEATVDYGSLLVTEKL